MNVLEGKVTLVTGAKGGLGSFVTEAFQQQPPKMIGRQDLRTFGVNLSVANTHLINSIH